MPLYNSSSSQEVITGATGAKGDKGDTGATGAKGDKGDTGLSASTAPEAWQNLTLTTGWSNYGTGYTTPQFRKLIGRLIEVIKKSSALVANEIITTLPVSYRPTEIMLITTWANGGTSRLQIEPSGVVKLVSGSNGGVGLSFLFGLD